MCEYCEGVQGHAMIDDDSFTVRLMPIYGQLHIDHECERSCDLSYDFCAVPVDYCPMCGRDLRGEER